MSNYISLSQAFAQWQEIAQSIPNDDTAMMAESWNDYTDSLAKDGQLCALQYHYAPAFDESMPGDGERFDALADDRAFILESMGVSLSAVFVPFSASRNKDEKNPSLNWIVTLKKDDRDILTSDYMQGCAHAPAYKHDNLAVTRDRIAAECETGKMTHSANFRPYYRVTRNPIPAPDAVDVLHSLLMDSSDVLNAGDFSDWCADFGYSDDSISARAIYDACIANAVKFRATFGEKTLRELSELFGGI